MSLKPSERFHLALGFAILFLVGAPTVWALRKNVSDQRVCTEMYLIAGGPHNTGTTTVLYSHNNSTATTQFGTNATSYSNGLWCVNLDSTATNSDYVGVVFHPSSSLALDALVQMYTSVAADITHINGTATTGGRVDANLTHVNGTATTATLDSNAALVTTANAHLTSTLYGLNALHVNGTATKAEVDNIHAVTVLVHTTISATAPTETSIRLSSGGSDQNDAYNGMMVILDGDEGGGLFVARSIIDYAGDTKTVTFSPALIHVPTAGGRVDIVPSNPQINDIDTETDALTTNLALVPKSNGTLAFNATANAAINGSLATSGNVATILGHLNGTLDAGTHLNSTAQVVAIEAALALAHGSGSWDAIGGAGETKEDIAAAVWNTTAASHVNSSIMGGVLNIAGTGIATANSHLNGTIEAGSHLNSTAQVEAIDTKLSTGPGPGVWSK